MNKRQIKKIQKQNMINFRTLNIKDDEILTINFDRRFSHRFIENYIQSIKYSIPNIKILVTIDGIKLGKIRSETNG